jgi:MarR family transcriptional regulator, organic hydroperoxide resistance regulator
VRPEEELRFLVLGAQREGSRGLAAALAPLGLTPAQSEVIRCLGDTGALSLKSLGEMLVCESGSPSRLVDTLVNRDIVVRTEDPNDRRQVALTLTSTGKKLDREVRKVEEAMYAAIGAQLGKAGMAQALAMLRPLVEGSVSGNALARRKAAKG